jgi:hypothetical protein
MVFVLDMHPSGRKGVRVAGKASNMKTHPLWVVFVLNTQRARVGLVTTTKMYQLHLKMNKYSRHTLYACSCAPFFFPVVLSTVIAMWW